MFGLVLFVFVISSLFIVLAIKIKWIGKIGQVLLKSVFLYLYIFNVYNISFSIGLHFKYANSNNTTNYNMNLIGVIVALLLSMFVIGILTLFERMLLG
jgi:hypothetical protein